MRILILCVLLLFTGCAFGKQPQPKAVQETFKQVTSPYLKVVNIYINDHLVELSPDARFDDDGATIYPVSGLDKFNLKYSLKEGKVVVSNKDGTEAIDVTDLYYIDNSIFIPIRNIFYNYCDDFAWNPKTRSAYLYLYGMSEEYPINESLAPEFTFTETGVTAYLNELSDCLHINKDCSAYGNTSADHIKELEVIDLTHARELGHKVCQSCEQTLAKWQQ